MDKYLTQAIFQVGRRLRTQSLDMGVREALEEDYLTRMTSSRSTSENQTFFPLIYAHKNKTKHEGEERGKETRRAEVAKPSN